MKFFMFDPKTYNAKTSFKSQLIAGIVLAIFLIVYYAIQLVIGFFGTLTIAPLLSPSTAPLAPIKPFLNLPEPMLHAIAIIGIILFIFFWILGLVIARALYTYTFIRLYRKYTNKKKGV